MGCNDCIHWKCEEMNYGELEDKWELAIGGTVTPGHRKRFSREAKVKGLSFEEVRLSYKYCQRGILTRFYIMKNSNDIKPLVSVNNCSEFQEGVDGDVTVNVPSPLWSACTTESHGHSLVRGIHFSPGIYERGIYFRVPMCGTVKPKVTKGKMEVTLYFNSNDEYLRWWGKLYPEEFRKLNGVS